MGGPFHLVAEEKENSFFMDQDETLAQIVDLFNALTKSLLPELGEEASLRMPMIELPMVFESEMTESR